VRNLIATLEERPQILLRHALIRTLRVLVPTLYVPALVSAAAVTILGGQGFAFRCAGTAALLVWTAVTFGGTVPINSAILGWAPDSPPADWRARVRRWERLDTARAVAAVLAYGFFLAALIWPGLSV
jgi:hypothetical protein